MARPLPAALLLACALAGASARHVLRSPAQLGGRGGDAAMPPPFTRPLALQTPPLTGQDVYILQNLLARSPQPPAVTSTYDAATAAAVSAFQASAALPASGALDAPTATAVLAQLGPDGYRWDGRPASAYGPQYKYLIHLPVSHNRSVETLGTVYDAGGAALFNFHARLHGIDAPPAPRWCSYSAGSTVGLNQFSDGGNTPTGLMEVDLNTPESNATEFGPWPINRCVRGLAGNAAWLMTNRADYTMVRDGILIHTGNWSEGCAWAPPAPMPDSLGCVHVWPAEINALQQLLQSRLGVVARPNTDGTLPYGPAPQGLLAVEEVD